jgi:hypothetical protein
MAESIGEVLVQKHRMELAQNAFYPKNILRLIGR